MTLAQLRQYVRDLTGVYSEEILSDDLINRWLSEAYTEVNLVADWPWLFESTSGTLPAGQTTIALPNSYYRVREVSLSYPNGLLYQVPAKLDTVPTVDSDDDVSYEISSAGVVTLSKPLTENVTWYAAYLKSSPSLSDSLPQASAMPAEFEPLLAYRAAQKALAYQADDSPRSNFYFGEYAAMLDNMVRYLTLDNDLGPIQIGGEILRVDTRTVGRVNVRFRSV